jgi:hypothetical protein
MAKTDDGWQKLDDGAHFTLGSRKPHSSFIRQSNLKPRIVIAIVGNSPFEMRSNERKTPMSRWRGRWETF